MASSHTIQLSVEPGAVWKRLTDIDSWPAWFPRLQTMTEVPTQIVEGATIAARISPLGITNRYAIIDAQPPAHFAIREQLGCLMTWLVWLPSSEWRWRIESQASGSSITLTAVMRPQTPLHWPAAVWYNLFNSMFSNAPKTSLESFVRHLSE